MRNISILVKPASSLCNMRCRYCFYTDEAENRSIPNTGIMNEDISKLLIRSAFDAVGENGQISFAFQGGEPTLAGMDYFRHFVHMVSKMNHKRIPIHYALQTNGLDLNAEWAAFFVENKFLVGISLDGDKTLHDEFRVDRAAKGTWARIVKKIDLMLRSGVDVNLLCVVTRRTAKNAVKVYHALKKTGVLYLQFIPCLDPIGETRGSMPYSLLPDDYGTFLCSLFDAWYLDWLGGHYTSIRLFDDYVHLAMGLPAGTCATSGSCGAYYVVESDGSVYPCDFYSLDEWKLGNIRQTSLQELERYDLAENFIKESLRRPEECNSCSWKMLCFGGCKRDWVTDPSGVSRNYYCRAFQKLFSYAASRIYKIAKEESYIRNRY